MKWIELPFAKFIGFQDYDKLYDFDRIGTINMNEINYFLPCKYDKNISIIYMKNTGVIEINIPYDKLKEKMDEVD